MKIISILLILVAFFCFFGCVWQGTSTDNNTLLNNQGISVGAKNTIYMGEGLSSVDLISKVVTELKRGGAMFSQAFELKKGEIIKSSDLNVVGLKPNQLVFSICTCAGFTEGQIEAGISENKDYSYLKSNLDLNIKVSVICDKNGKKLKALLDSIGKQANISPMELCRDENVSPCCIIYPKKA